MKTDTMTFVNSDKKTNNQTHIVQIKKRCEVQLVKLVPTKLHGWNLLFIILFPVPT